MDELRKQKASENRDIQTSDRLRKPLIVAEKTLKATHPKRRSVPRPSGVARARSRAWPGEVSRQPVRYPPGLLQALGPHPCRLDPQRQPGHSRLSGSAPALPERQPDRDPAHQQSSPAASAGAQGYRQQCVLCGP